MTKLQTLGEMEAENPMAFATEPARKPTTTFTVKVVDTKGKYAEQTFTVQASAAFVAESKAIEMFIQSNGHPARKPTQRMSSYFARFSSAIQ